MNLKENLESYSKSIFDVPLVMQYNKRDLGEKGVELLDLNTMESDLNGHLKVPSFPAAAVSGHNVIHTLRHIVTATVATLEKELK